MMATPEPIEFALSTFGVEMCFDDFSILGIPGFSMETFLSEEKGTYKINKQLYSFRIATRDILTHTLIKGTQFTVDTDNYTMTFRVSIPPVDDMTGWSELLVDFISRERLCFQ